MNTALAGTFVHKNHVFIYFFILLYSYYAYDEITIHILTKIVDTISVNNWQSSSTIMLFHASMR